MTMHEFTNCHTRFPYVFFVIALIIGIGMAHILPISVPVYRLLLFVCIGLVGSFFYLAIKFKWKAPMLNGVAFAAFLIILSCLGCLLTWRNHPVVDDRHFSRFESTHLLGFTSSEPKISGQIRTVEMTVNYAKTKDGLKQVNGKLLLKVKIDETNLSLDYGDELRIVSNFERIAPPHNPHEFDYASYMANRHIWHQSFLSPDLIRRTGRIKGNCLTRYAFSTRKKMVDKFVQYFKQEDASALLSTLVLGYRASLDKELIQAFSATGTIHVLAVSGMHVGIVFAFLSFSLQWMDKGRFLKYIRLFLLLLFVWAYALITGFAPSILRAAFMISIFIVGNTLRRTNNTYNSIAVSAFFLLLYNPNFLADIGFQLSYLAVIGIVWVAPLLAKLVLFKNSLMKNCWTYITVCCAAQLTNFPLVLYYFHLFPVYFLPANLFVLLPVNIIIYTGFLLLLLPINMFTQGIADLLEQFILLVNHSLIQIEHWPFATITEIWLTKYEYLLLYLIIISLILALQFASRKLFYFSIYSVLILGLIVNLKIWCKHQNKQLIVFNVRNHLAIGLIDGLKPIVYTDADSVEQSFMQYAVIPTLHARSSKHNLSLLPRAVKFSFKDTYIENGHIQFAGKHLYILDGRKTDTLTSSPDWFLIRNNPKKPLDSLTTKLKKETLIIMDGSNNQRTIDKWQEDANRLNFPVYCLKDNFAYVWKAK